MVMFNMSHKNKHNRFTLSCFSGFLLQNKLLCSHVCICVPDSVYSHKLPDDSNAAQKHFFTSCLLILFVKVQTTDMKAFQMMSVMHLLGILWTLQILIIQEKNRESAN